MHVGTLVTRSDIVFAVEMGWPAQLTEAVWLAGQELVLCAEEACDSVGLLSRHGITVPCNPHDYVTLKAQLPALLGELGASPAHFLPSQLSQTRPAGMTGTVPFLVALDFAWRGLGDDVRHGAAGTSSGATGDVSTRVASLLAAVKVQPLREKEVKELLAAVEDEMKASGWEFGPPPQFKCM